jgi:hypothetical protein
MNISPEEIDSIEEAGFLDNSPVKLIRTKGGFYIAVGKPKGKNREEALSAGSHPAIVKFNIEKQYPSFMPNMMKSESAMPSVVEQHSHFLSDDLRKSGHDIYSVQSGPSIDFHVTKHNMKVSTIQGNLVEDVLVLSELSIDKKFARALAGATTEKALQSKASKIRVGGSNG